MKLTKNDPDNYEYKGYGIGFDARLRFLWRVGSKFAISGVDNNLLVHDDNINKDTLIYVEEPTDRLDDTTKKQQSVIILFMLLTTKRKFAVQCNQQFFLC